MMKQHKTIIIGGGISGLSCGRKLQDSNEDFLLITEDLGGRMLSSKSFGIGHGAAYVTSDYKNVLKYVDKQERFRLRDFHFYYDGQIKNIFHFSNIKRAYRILKLLYLVSIARKHFLKYRKRAPYQSIKYCFESNRLLLKYWNMSASTFIKKHRLEEIDKLFGNPVNATTAFIDSSKVNAFYYLGMFFCVILPTWIVDFKHTVKKLTKDFENKIKISSVIKVKKQKDGKFKVHTSKGDFLAHNIVFAAPQKSLAKVYNLPKPHIQQSAYTFHIVGIRRDIYQNKKAVCFRPKNHDIYMLWRQKSGADLVYSKHPKPDFNKYYERYHIIKKVHWHPGMIIPKHSFIDQKLEKNVYLASDYNLSLLEDSFLTGLYAANQIINSK